MEDLCMEWFFKKESENSLHSTRNIEGTCGAPVYFVEISFLLYLSEYAAFLLHFTYIRKKLI